MRKILFRILIAILLFLLVVLGVAYYQNTKPLSVIKHRFGVQETVVIEPSRESEQKVQVDATEKIKEEVASETGNISPSTRTTVSGSIMTQGSSQLSEQDKRDLEKIVDGLVIK
jgi:predicted Holliday junction resolvase-like endonuclease